MATGYETPNPDQQQEQRAAPAGVWPPPPIVESEVTTTFPFSSEMRVAEGSVPEFREGLLIFSDRGLLLHGKAVVRYEIQVLVMLASVLILTASELRPVCMIVYLMMDWAFRRDTQVEIAYHNIQRIVLNAANRRVCLVYDAPNYKGMIKRHSLTTQMEQDFYEAFVAIARPHLTEKIGEGPTKRWLSPLAWMTLVYWVLWLGFLAGTPGFWIFGFKFHWKI